MILTKKFLYVKLCIMSLLNRLEDFSKEGCHAFRTEVEGKNNTAFAHKKGNYYE